MRIARKYLKDSGCEQVFHVMSRVVERRLIFGDEEKGMLQQIMRQLEGFSGCEVLTYCMMGNHVHLLLRVPRKPELAMISEDEVMMRVGKAYPREFVEELEECVRGMRGMGQDGEAEAVLDQYRRRMYDLSEFMKGFKQRVTQWINRRMDRIGTLWEERFKSYLVEGEIGTIRRVAGYIDLNPVRAGLVEEAGDYKWSGYGETSRGGVLGRGGIRWIMRYPGDKGNGQAVVERYGEYLRSRKSSVGEGRRADRGNIGHRAGLQLLMNGLVVGDERRVKGHMQRLADLGLIRGREDLPGAGGSAMDEGICFARRRRQSASNGQFNRGKGGV